MICWSNSKLCSKSNWQHTCSPRPLDSLCLVTHKHSWKKKQPYSSSLGLSSFPLIWKHPSQQPSQQMLVWKSCDCNSSAFLNQDVSPSSPIYLHFLLVCHGPQSCWWDNVLQLHNWLMQPISLSRMQHRDHTNSGKPAGLQQHFHLLSCSIYYKCLGEKKEHIEEA